MESFMELIFSNLFLIIIILSSIFSILNKNKEEKKKNTNRPKPVPTPPRKMNEKEYPARKKERPTRTYETKPDPVAMKSIEDQQQEQMERLREKFKTDVNEAVESLNEYDLTKNEIKLESLTNKNSSLPKKEQLELKFNQKSVLQGVMMSELLGPPRSRKVYRNIIQERKIK